MPAVGYAYASSFKKLALIKASFLILLQTSSGLYGRVLTEHT